MFIVFILSQNLRDQGIAFMLILQIW